MLRRLTSVILAIYLFCTFSTSATLAAAHTEHASICDHSHAATAPDQAAVVRAKVEWAEKIDGLGGKAFYAKEDLLSYLICIGYPNAHEKVASLVDDGVYAIVSPSAARSLGVRVPASAADDNEEIVILQGIPKWCKFCRKVAIFIARPEGSPQVVSASDTCVTMYCPRCVGTWYDYNPY